MSSLQPKEELADMISLAARLHIHQYDKSGEPYILHTLKVMHYLKSGDYQLRAIAVGHDIIEDTGATYEELRVMGFSERVINGIEAMTKRRGQTPEEYLIQLKGNIDAVKVKLADLRHNSDIRRLKGVTDKDFERIKKYMKTELTDFLNNQKGETK